MPQSENVATKEKKFIQALRSLFIGERIEGESGFINMMKIKSNYFSEALHTLMDIVSEEIAEFPQFREELFDKLYSFFKRYFSETGSVYHVFTPLKERIYERIYSQQRDVSLFWKTHSLYYVKSDRLWKTMTIRRTIGGETFSLTFDTSNLQHAQNNEKREIVFELCEINSEGKRIVFNVRLSERGRKTRIRKILADLKKAGASFGRRDLEAVFSTFKRQNEVDFFINKDARAFLREEFDLWLKNYLVDDESIFSEERLKQLKALKNVAYQVIELIARFEDELVKIWNKPRFVLDSEYVITLNRIGETKKGIQFVEEVLNHPGIQKQLQEWKNLGFIGNDFSLSQIFLPDKKGKKLNQKYASLPLDTQYFDEKIKLHLLSLFENLEESLDGWLIHSESYQALNTIKDRFRNRIQLIYIDPPFNLGENADFQYKVNYKDSTWLTMLENRLSIAREILSEEGSIFVRCDHNGNMLLRLLLNQIFGEVNFKNEIIVNKSVRIKTKGNKFPTWHDTIFYYAKNKDLNYFRHISVERKETKWRSIDTDGESWEVVPEEKAHLYPPEYLKRDDAGRLVTRARIILGKAIMPPKGRRFPPQKTISKLEKERRLRLSRRGNPQMMKPDVVYLSDNWSDIYGYSSKWGFTTENSEQLLKRVISTSTREGDLVMDFFLGSGTTIAVAHKLNRKWIGIEMGRHIYSVALPRMKRVLFYDKSGISKDSDVRGRYNPKNANGFFKYSRFEQYEEILKKVKYRPTKPFHPIEGDKSTLDAWKAMLDYMFLNDEKLTGILALDRDQNRITFEWNKLYPRIDLAETLANLMGKKIVEISKNGVILEDYVAKNGDSRIAISFDRLPLAQVIPLIWW